MLPPIRHPSHENPTLSTESPNLCSLQLATPARSQSCQSQVSLMKRSMGNTRAVDKEDFSQQSIRADMSQPDCQTFSFRVAPTTRSISASSRASGEQVGRWTSGLRSWSRLGDLGPRRGCRGCQREIAAPAHGGRSGRSSTHFGILHLGFGFEAQIRTFWQSFKGVRVPISTMYS